MAGAAQPETLHTQLHEVSGPLMTLALFGACVAVARRLESPWATYKHATALVGLVATVGLIAAYRRDAACTGLVQRARSSPPTGCGSRPSAGTSSPANHSKEKKP